MAIPLHCAATLSVVAEVERVGADRPQIRGLPYPSRTQIDQEGDNAEHLLMLTRGLGPDRDHLGAVHGGGEPGATH